MFRIMTVSASGKCRAGGKRNGTFDTTYLQLCLQFATKRSKPMFLPYPLARYTMHNAVDTITMMPQLKSILAVYFGRQGSGGPFEASTSSSLPFIYPSSHTHPSVSGIFLAPSLDRPRAPCSKCRQKSSDAQC